MDEASARNVVLLRAFDTATPRSAIWSDEDRAWASRAAAEVAGANADGGRFLSVRASLGVERLGSRDRSVRRALGALQWRSWIGAIVVAIALVLGFAIDAIGPAHRVNILAFPLLGLLAWNLLVYALMIGASFVSIAKRNGLTPGPLRRLVARLGHGVADSRWLVEASPPLLTFTRDWMKLSASLTAVRVAAILHTAAFALALGAIVSLYLRGLVFDYRAGWESTFLDASGVRHLLAFVLAPASAITHIAIPDAQHLALVRFPESAGENAAPWLHLYAATVGLFVLLPRAVFASAAQWRERRLTARFPLRLDGAYFQGLGRMHRGEPAQLRVLPYSYQVSPQATLGLNAIMTRVYGPSAQVVVDPSIPFSGEDALPAGLFAAGDPALIVPLFSMSATPEAEHHCALVSALQRRSNGNTPLAVLVDESSFRQRFADQSTRVEERRTAWRRLFERIGRTPVFVDLVAPDVTAAERALTHVLDTELTGSART